MTTGKQLNTNQLNQYTSKSLTHKQVSSAFRVKKLVSKARFHALSENSKPLNGDKQQLYLLIFTQHPYGINSISFNR
jgi:hypothetical protein